MGANHGTHAADAGRGDGALRDDGPAGPLLNGSGARRDAGALIRELTVEGAAAQALRASLVDVLGEDAVLAGDMIEGETNLHEAVAAAVRRLGEIKAHDDGLGAYVKQLQARRDRLAKQGEAIRTAILVALEAAGLRTLECAAATLTIARTAPKVIVTNEAEIPARYWARGEPRLDKRALLADLKAGATAIPGCTISNAGETLVVRGL